MLMRKATVRVATVEVDEAKSLSLAAIGLYCHVQWLGGVLDTDTIYTDDGPATIARLAAELIQAGLIEEVEGSAATALPTGAPGFIYVIETLGHFKIGVTKNVKARLKGLQGAHPQSLRLVFDAHVNDCMFVEGFAHARLKEKRTLGEWFACTEQEAVSAVKSAIAALEEIKKK